VLLLNVCVVVVYFVIDPVRKLLDIPSYVSKQLFSKIKLVKSITINGVDSKILESCLRVATSHICPNIENLVTEKQWRYSFLQNKTSKKKIISVFFTVLIQIVLSVKSVM
jgi:hypothetical protein